MRSHILYIQFLEDMTISVVKRRGLAAKTSGTAGIADTAVSLRNKHVAIKKSKPFFEQFT